MICDNCGTRYNEEDRYSLEEYKGRYGKRLTRLKIECPYCGHVPVTHEATERPLDFS